MFAHLGSDHLFQNLVKGTRDLPLGVMTLEFSQVGDVTDVVAFAGILPVGPLNLAPGQLFNLSYGLDHRDAIRPSSAEVVDLAASWVFRERVEGAYHVL